MSECKFPGCKNFTKTKVAKFCSLSCASKFNSRPGVPRTDRRRVCIQCNSEFLRVEVDQKFCSRSCSATFNNALRAGDHKCQGCGERITKEQQSGFCSRTCKSKDRLERWLAGEASLASNKYGTADWAKSFVLQEAEGRCEGIDSRTNARCLEDRVTTKGTSILDLDHIDGNWQNNGRENLRVLCPNCHRLTETWGAGNMGSGRTWKANYNQFHSKNSKEMMS